MDALKVWTIQPFAAWEQFQQQGVITCQARFVDSYDKPAYAWMRHQMARRLPGYQGDWPVWVWVKWDKTSPRPDISAEGHFPHGQKGVMLECLIPQESVLISDFELWHFVMNNQYLSLSEAESEKWEARAASGTITPATLLEEKEKSWEKIFDFTSPRDPDWIGDKSEAQLQGCIESLRLDQIVTVTPFTAR